MSRKYKFDPSYTPQPRQPSNPTGKIPFRVAMASQQAREAYRIGCLWEFYLKAMDGMTELPTQAHLDAIAARERRAMDAIRVEIAQHARPAKPHLEAALKLGEAMLDGQKVEQIARKWRLAEDATDADRQWP